MDKFSDGPWMYYKEPSEHYLHKIYCRTGLICAMPGWLVQEDMRLEQEANARLLFASRDLFAAAELANQLCQGVEGMSKNNIEQMAYEASQVLSAAIAKARGQS